jgi:hypothetical protein
MKLQQRLKRLAQEYSHGHAYTLALILQADTGYIINGQLAK